MIDLVLPGYLRCCCRLLDLAPRCPTVVVLTVPIACARTLHAFARVTLYIYTRYCLDIIFNAADYPRCPHLRCGLRTRLQHTVARSHTCSGYGLGYHFTHYTTATPHSVTPFALFCSTLYTFTVGSYVCGFFGYLLTFTFTGLHTHCPLLLRCCGCGYFGRFGYVTSGLLRTRCSPQFAGSHTLPRVRFGLHACVLFPHPHLPRSSTLVYAPHAHPTVADVRLPFGFSLQFHWLQFYLLLPVAYRTPRCRDTFYPTVAGWFAVTFRRLPAFVGSFTVVVGYAGYHTAFTVYGLRLPFAFVFAVPGTATAHTFTDTFPVPYTVYFAVPLPLPHCHLLCQPPLFPVIVLTPLQLLWIAVLVVLFATHPFGRSPVHLCITCHYILHTRLWFAFVGHFGCVTFCVLCAFARLRTHFFLRVAPHLLLLPHCTPASYVNLHPVYTLLLHTRILRLPFTVWLLRIHIRWFGLFPFLIYLTPFPVPTLPVRCGYRSFNPFVIYDLLRYLTFISRWFALHCPIRSSPHYPIYDYNLPHVVYVRYVTRLPYPWFPLTFPDTPLTHPDVVLPRLFACRCYTHFTLLHPRRCTVPPLYPGLRLQPVRVRCCYLTLPHLRWITGLRLYTTRSPCPVLLPRLHVYVPTPRLHHTTRCSTIRFTGCGCRAVCSVVVLLPMPRCGYTHRILPDQPTHAALPPVARDHVACGSTWTTPHTPT